MPAVSESSPTTSNVGSDVAVLGAMAPFENVVVVRGVALGVGARSVSVLIIVVSVALNVGLLVPAAESTHVFISVRLMRLALSARALATATTERLAESAAPFRGATKVAN
jgi:hypothetical protein